MSKWLGVLVLAFLFVGCSPPELLDLDPDAVITIYPEIGMYRMNKGDIVISPEAGWYFTKTYLDMVNAARMKMIMEQEGMTPKKLMDMGLFQSSN